MKSAPYLNPDPYCHFIGPKNLGEVLIDGELTTCLLDNGAQINFVKKGHGYHVPGSPRSGDRRADTPHSRDRRYHGGA